MKLTDVEKARIESIYELKPFESCLLHFEDKKPLYITRVPGGWLFELSDYPQAYFIPYNTDFLELLSLEENRHIPF